MIKPQQEHEIWTKPQQEQTFVTTRIHQNSLKWTIQATKLQT